MATATNKVTLSDFVQRHAIRDYAEPINTNALHLPMATRNPHPLLGAATLAALGAIFVITAWWMA